MFRRSEKETPAPTVEKVGGKGRPTPSRKEAQAAAKERARSGMDKKAAKQLLNERQKEANAKMRAGMKAGDERYLMERDKGPVRRFVRDFVDVRVSFMEFLLPLLLVLVLLQISTVPVLVRAVVFLQPFVIVLVVLEAVLLNFRLGKAIRTRFPDGETRGWRFYAMMRAVQIRRLRLPKPRLKVREPLPERY